MRSITSWGMYPKIQADLQMPTTKSAFAKAIRNFSEVTLRGNGRSYGDSALGETIVSSLGNDHLVELNRLQSTIRVHSGITLEKLLEFLVPRGYFLPVVPGTKYITVGGAVASDIHGKNHHKEGTFSDHITKMSIILSDGQLVECSRELNVDLFLATCGGMGLTGYIHEVEFYLKPIQNNAIDQVLHKSNNLDELFQLFEQYNSATYSVAWIDCLSEGEKLGRGLVFVGEHSQLGNRLSYKESKILIPVPRMPEGLLNSLSVRAFNFFYYNKKLRKISRNEVGLDTFFFPLDKIQAWNNLYGQSGFTQYQFVLPKASGREGMRRVLEKVAENKNASFLAVLKLFGEKNSNFLSFPIEGYTLSLDFRITPGLFEFLDALNEIVIEHGGRVYLTKDVSLSAEHFKRMYGQHIDAFQEVRHKYNSMKFASLQSRRLGL